MASAPATKTALPTPLDVVPQFFSAVFNPDGATPMGQVQDFTFSQAIAQNEAGRIGDSLSTFVNQGVSGNATIVLYRDATLLEMAIFLGNATAPAAGQTIELDPNLAAFSFLVGNYTAEGTTATLKNTDNVVNFKPNSLAGGWSVGGEQIVTIVGSVERHFIEVPV